MKKLLLTTIAFAFAFCGAIASKVLVAPTAPYFRINALSFCVQTGIASGQTCTLTAQSNVCETTTGAPLYDIRSGTICSAAAFKK